MALGLPDLVYATAHLYGAWMLGGHMAAMASANGISWPAAMLAGQLAWIAWALALILYGERIGDLFSRYVGVVLACVPAVTEVNWEAGSTNPYELWVLAETGVALTAYAAARLRRSVDPARVNRARGRPV